MTQKVFSWRPTFRGQPCGCEIHITDPPEKLVNWLQACHVHDELSKSKDGFDDLMRLVIDESVRITQEQESMTDEEANELRKQHLAYHGL